MRPDDETGSERAGATCDDCFFRRALLCAIAGNTPCPTFRPADRGFSAPAVSAAPRTPNPRVHAAA